MTSNRGWSGCAAVRPGGRAHHPPVRHRLQRTASSARGGEYKRANTRWSRPWLPAASPIVAGGSMLGLCDLDASFPVRRCNLFSAGLHSQCRAGLRGIGWRLEAVHARRSQYGCRGMNAPDKGLHGRLSCPQLFVGAQQGPCAVLVPGCFAHSYLAETQAEVLGRLQSRRLLANSRRSTWVCRAILPRRRLDQCSAQHQTLSASRAGEVRGAGCSARGPAAMYA